MGSMNRRKRSWQLFALRLLGGIAVGIFLGGMFTGFAAEKRWQKHQTTSQEQAKLATTHGAASAPIVRLA